MALTEQFDLKPLHISMFLCGMSSDAGVETVTMETVKPRCADDVLVKESDKTRWGSRKLTMTRILQGPYGFYIQ